MLKSNLRDYSDAHILVSGTKTVPNPEIVVNPSNRKKMTNCTSFTDCISEINNIQIDNAKGIAICII